MAHISLPQGFPGIRGPMIFRPETSKPLNELVDKGTFDIDVKVSSDEMFGRVSTDSDPSGFPTASGAMRELGIKLELVKGPVEMLVIDSIDRPTPN